MAHLVNFGFKQSKIRLKLSGFFSKTAASSKFPLSILRNYDALIENSFFKDHFKNRGKKLEFLICSMRIERTKTKEINIFI